MATTTVETLNSSSSSKPFAIPSFRLCEWFLWRNLKKLPPSKQLKYHVQIVLQHVWLNIKNRLKTTNPILSGNSFSLVLLQSQMPAMGEIFPKQSQVLPPQDRRKLRQVWRCSDDPISSWLQSPGTPRKLYRYVSYWSEMHEWGMPLWLSGGMVTFTFSSGLSAFLTMAPEAKNFKKFVKN